MAHDTPVPLGRTSLTVTALGFGATAIGGMYTEVSDHAAGETVTAAWEAGLRYFDAAPQYGRGNGEVRLGRGLADYRRDDYVLSSKVGRLLRADAPPHPDDFDSTGRPYDAGAPDVATVYDYSRDGVLRSIEESLARLGTDRLDIVLVHDPDDYVDEALATALPTLIELREQKVVTAIGAGMNQTAALERFARESDPDMFLLAGRYTLVGTDCAAVVPATVRTAWHRRRRRRCLQQRSARRRRPWRPLQLRPRTAPTSSHARSGSRTSAGGTACPSRLRHCNSPRPTPSSPRCSPEPEAAPRSPRTWRCSISRSPTSCGRT